MDHILAPEELAALQQPHALHMFNRLITGRRAGEALVNIEYTGEADSDHRRTDENGQRLYTAREVNQARGIGFAMREAYRRADWLAKRIELESAAATGETFHWKQNRPARR